MLSFLNDFPFLQLFVGFMIIFFWLFFLFISKNHLTPFFHTKKCIHSNITARNNFKYPCSVLFSSLYHFHHNFFHIFLRFFLSERKIKFIYVQRELIGKKIIRGYLFFLFRNRQPSKWYWQTNVKRQHEKKPNVIFNFSLQNIFPICATFHWKCENWIFPCFFGYFVWMGIFVFSSLENWGKICFFVEIFVIDVFLYIESSFWLF